MTRTIVLGLDGGTWDVVSSWMESGCLPNMNALVEAGVSGSLQSVVPPLTAPAWVSMATGLNPGKTGVFNFINNVNGEGYSFEPLESSYFRDQAFWDILEHTDQSVGVFNFPMLYPPYELNGFMVSGIGSANEDQITYPASLQSELDEATGGYEVKVPYADPKYADKPDKLLLDLLKLLDKRKAAIEYLLKTYDPDVFFGVLSATDWAQHYFWRFYDEQSPKFEKSQYSDALKQIWTRVDEIIGLLQKLAAADDANIMLVSDHGFGTVKGTFYVNEWLESQDFLIPETPLSKRIRSKYFPHLRAVAESIVELVPRLNGVARSLGSTVRSLPSEYVDYERSLAFSEQTEVTGVGSMYILSNDQADHERIRKQLTEFAVRNGVNIDLLEPDEIYQGPHTDKAPDLYFTLDGHYITPFFSVESDPLVEGPPSPARSGGHRPDGMYVLAGPSIDESTEQPAKITDIAPTILHLQKSPIPENIDGNVLPSASDGEPEFAPRSRLLRERSTGNQRGDYEAVKERLEELGYM